MSSSEKHIRGNVFQSENIPDLIKPYNLRLKRFTDIIIILLIILILPVILFRIKSFKRLIYNIIAVSLGKRTWIGLSDDKFKDHGLKKGIITMVHLAGSEAEPSLIKSLDNLYLQEFLPEHEIWTVIKNIQHLDSGI